MTNYDDLDRDVMLTGLDPGPDAMGTPNGYNPGLVAPPEPGDPGPVVGPVAPAAPRSGAGRSYQDILSNYTYGAKGLGEAEKELGEGGYKLQKHSDGRIRGRIFDPSGLGIDVTDTNEGNDWWNNQTGGKWGNHVAGYGSPEVTEPQGGPSPNLLPTGEATGLAAGQGGGNSDMFQRLMAQLQAETGIDPNDREALMALLGA